MCRPASLIVTKNAVLWSKLAESHETIISKNNLDDTTREPDFVRVEIGPPDGNYTLPPDEWAFRADQDFLPKWWLASEDEKRVRAELPAWIAAKVVLPDEKREKITQHCVAVYGCIDSVRGSARIDSVCGSARIDSVRDSARIDSVRGSARIDSVWGSARIDSVCGSAHIDSVRDSARIDSVCDSARIGYVRDSAGIDSVWGSARIGSVCGSAHINSVRGSAGIGSVRDSASIGYMRDSAVVESIDGVAIVVTYTAQPLCILHGIHAVLINRSGDYPVCYTGAGLNAGKYE